MTPAPQAAPIRAPVPEAAATGVARNALHLVAGQVITTVLAVVLSAALGRFLGAADFGILFLVTSMSAFSYVIVEWGQSQHAIREIARQPERAGELLGTGLAVRCGGALAMAAITGLAAGVLGYDARTRQLAALFVITFLPFFLSQAYGMVFRGRERMDLDALVSVLNKGLVLALTLAALALGGGLTGAIVAQGLAGAGALAAAALLLHRLGVRPRGASFLVAREMLLGGSPLVAMSLAIAAQGYLDAVVLSRLVPGEEVGWYGAARTILGTLIAPATIMGTAAFPRLSRAAGHPPSFAAEIRAAFRPLLGLAALAGVGTYLFAGVAIGLVYGADRFAPAALILQVFAPGLFLLFVDVLLCTAVIASGQAKALAIAKAVTVVLGTGLDLVLVPLCHDRLGNGGIGLVIAFGATEFVMFAVALRLLPRRTLDASLLADVGRALAASAATLIVMRALPPLSPFLAIPLCVCAFAALAGAVGLIRRSELASFQALLRSRRSP